MTEAKRGTERSSPVLAVVDVETLSGVHALKHASFDCLSGEIHGLVGENAPAKARSCVFWLVCSGQTPGIFE